jgi:hypothetical protein
LVIANRIEYALLAILSLGVSWLFATGRVPMLRPGRRPLEITRFFGALMFIICSIAAGVRVVRG